MKKTIKLLWITLVSAGVLVPVHAGVTVTMEELIDTAATVTIDTIGHEVRFGGFGMTATPAIDLGEVEVNFFETLPGLILMSFSGEFGAFGGGEAEMTVQYTVSSTTGLIRDIGQSFTLGLSGNGGSVQMVKSAYTNSARTSLGAVSTIGWFSSVFDQSDPNAELDDDLELGSYAAWVTDEWTFDSNPGGTVSSNAIYQRWSLIPEPGEYALFAGVGLVGFVILRRLVRS